VNRTQSPVPGSGKSPSEPDLTGPRHPYTRLVNEYTPGAHMLIVVREKRRPAFQEKRGCLVLYHVGDCMCDHCAYENQSEKRKRGQEHGISAFRLCLKSGPVQLLGAPRSACGATSNQSNTCVWFEHKFRPKSRVSIRNSSIYSSRAEFTGIDVHTILISSHLSAPSLSG